MQWLKKRIQKLGKFLGPGFITGASDDDPSGIATYAQTGAQFGYGQLWMSLFSIPFMIAVQEMCGRIGLITGQGLAGVMRRHYSKKLLYVFIILLLVANTINIGANLGAMAAAAQLVTGLPFAMLLICMMILTLLLEIFIPYPTYARYLKYLTLSLFAYIIAGLIVKQDWAEVLYATLVPHIGLTREYLMNIVAFLGTTISPYLFFWQANEEVEEEIAEHKLKRLGYGHPHINAAMIKHMQMDTGTGMILSNVVAFFIIITSAATLGRNGITTIQTADQAALALRPIAGEFAFLLFALGIIGTGLLAVPILAGSAAYAFAEAFRWRAGLYQKLQRAHGFYGVITLATLVGLLINFTSIKPFQMLYYAAIVNGITAPPLIIGILLIANNKEIMGSRVNTKTSNILGIIIAAVMSIAALIFIIGSL